MELTYATRRSSCDEIKRTVSKYAMFEEQKEGATKLFSKQRLGTAVGSEDRKRLTMRRQYKGHHESSEPDRTSRSA